MQRIARRQLHYYLNNMQNKKLILTYQNVPYIEDVSSVFSLFAHLPWAMFLDSGRPQKDNGRYEIFSAHPYKTFLTRGKKTIVSVNGCQQVELDDPFALLAKELAVSVSDESSLPFTGGAIGYFSYDLGRKIEKIPTIADDDLNIPEMAIGIYRWVYVCDHLMKSATLVGDLTDHRVRLYWNDLIDKVSVPEVKQSKNILKATGTIKSNMGEAEYHEKFSKVKHYISTGDCYQVNLAQRFSVDVEGDPWQGYQELRQINPSPFSAYINVPDCTILSVSPERFISLADNTVETKPIKGTRPRATDSIEDEKLKVELENSTKDRAENVMIVDLLRNDLSKCCEINSVKVTKLFDIESFPTVHHLVSTIQGKLPENFSPVQLLRSCFPGGSITGAPKVRSMEIIEELEPHRRGIYCGSVGYIGFNGNMDTNIAIRTLIVKDNKAYFFAGGGLVWDSDGKEEYQETFDKAAAMFKFFGQ